jgi:DNA-binding transcriptional regulator YhcF (GntR family)
VAMKKAHKSGEVLKIKELSLLIGCSYNSTNFHLSLFQKLGLLVIDKGKLFFVSTRKLTWEKETKHLIQSNKVVKRKLYLEFKETQIKELKKEIKAFVLLNSLVKQGHIQKNEQRPTPFHAGISAESLGKKINRSVSTGQRLITRLRKDKIIKVTPKFDFIGNMTKDEFNFARTNFLIPQWSKFNDGIVIRQMYSEMEIIKKDFVIKKLNDTLVKVRIKKTIKTEEKSFLPFFIVRPSGYFTINYLYKIGYNKDEAKKIFKPSIISVYGLFNSRNIRLMAFKDLAKRID